jgi:hypothetical protein
MVRIKRGKDGRHFSAIQHWINGSVELLHSHTTTQFYWSSRLTVCFLPRRAAVHTRGVLPHFWNRDPLLAMPQYIGDPNVIPDHRPWPMTFATGFCSHPSCPASILIAGHRLIDILLGSHTALTHCWGGGGVCELLHFHTTTQSHWSSGSTFASRLGGQRFMPRGCTHTSGTGISCYRCLATVHTLHRTQKNLASLYMSITDSQFLLCCLTNLECSNLG